MIGLVKIPVPEPFVVWLPATVGFDPVPQQTPRAIIAKPPSEVTFPPELAELCVIAEGAVVERIAAPGINVSSLLYEVPSLFTATRRKW